MTPKLLAAVLLTLVIVVAVNAVVTTPAQRAKLKVVQGGAGAA